MHSIRLLGIVVLCSTLATQPLFGQARELRSGVFRMPAAATIAGDTDEHPPVDLLFLKSTGWSLLFGVSGGLTGMLVDDLYCESEHGDEEGFIFGPCFFYTAAATPAGWFAGSATGAAFGAVRVARRRGCTSRFASWHALGGALLGVAPGAIIIASRSDIGGPARSWLVAGAPIWAGLGATLALQGCRT